MNNINDNKEDLRILPVKTDTTGMALNRQINEIMPNLSSSFILLVIGSRGSGKGVTLINLLYRFLHCKDNIDYLFYISPTIMSDRTMACIREDYGGSIYDKYDDNIVRDIIKFQESYPVKERKRTLICLDDLLGFKTPFADHLTSRHRHYNTNMVFMTQSLKQIAKAARNQATNVILFRTKSGKELTDLYEIYGAMYCNKKNFVRMMKYATRERYSFLYLRLDVSPPRAYRCFLEDITDKFCNDNDNNLDNEINNNNIE